MNLMKKMERILNALDGKNGGKQRYLQGKMEAGEDKTCWVEKEENACIYILIPFNVSGMVQFNVRPRGTQVNEGQASKEILMSKLGDNVEAIR